MRKQFSKKGVTGLLAVAMVFGLLPGTGKSVMIAQAEENVLSSRVYATKNDLQTKYDLDDSTTDKVIQRLYFGWNGSGEQQVWRIAGHDSAISGDNIVLLADSSMGEEAICSVATTRPYDWASDCYYETGEPSQVDPTHYGTSDLRLRKLKSVETDETYFSKKHQSMMNETVITEYDFNNKVPYTVTDKLYTAYGVTPSPAVDIHYISVGTNSEDFLNGNLRIDPENWPQVGEFWLRTRAFSNYVTTASPSEGRVLSHLVITPYDVVPAFDLNLSNVLFSSIAKAPSGSADLDVEKIMTLRYADNDNRIKSIAEYNADGVSITKGADTGKIFLYVQGNDGKDWVYSKEVTGTEVVTTETIATATEHNVDLSLCKIWLETTDEDAGMTYAKEVYQHFHTYGTEWKSDVNGHWHECECSDKADFSEHNLAWIIDKEATESETGSKHEECTVCSYKKASVVIPKIETPETPKPPVEPETPIDPKPPVEPETPKLEPGKKFTDKKTKAEYKAKADGSVEYVRPTSKTTKVTIPTTIQIDNVPYKVTSIAAKAFKGNKRITTIKMGSNIITIGKEAFSGCTKLKSVTLGKNVSTISDKAFYKCTVLKKIIIPGRVTKIGKSAFEGCKKLKTITIKTTKLKSVGKKAIKEIDKKATIKVPKKQYSKYKRMFKSTTGFKKPMKIKK